MLGYDVASALDLHVREREEEHLGESTVQLRASTCSTHTHTYKHKRWRVVSQHAASFISSAGFATHHCLSLYVQKTPPSAYSVQRACMNTRARCVTQTL